MRPPRNSGRTVYISRRIYDVPRRDNPRVKGVEPGKAMPIPYTNACGAACHDTSNL